MIPEYIDTVEVDGQTFEIFREKSGRIMAYCNNEPVCELIEGHDYRRQIEGVIEGAY